MEATHTYNAANELTRLHDGEGWTYFAYDANGNTVKEQTPSYTRYYDWDGRDMLVGVRSTEPGWTENVIRYNGEASRVSLSDSTGTTYHTWDGEAGRVGNAGRIGTRVTARRMVVKTHVGTRR